MRWVIESVIALSPSPGGFTASDLASQVRVLSKQSESEYGARRAAYDLKKLRGKKIVRRIGKTRRYESMGKGLRAMAALVVLRNEGDQALAGGCAGATAFARRAESQSARHGLREHTQRDAGRFPGTGAGRLKIDNYFFGLRP